MSDEDNGVDFSRLTDAEVMRQLALRWKDRREMQQINVKTKAHATQQLNYFIGAFHALELCGRPSPKAALLLLALGQDSVQLWAKEKP